MTGQRFAGLFLKKGAVIMIRGTTAQFKFKLPYTKKELDWATIKFWQPNNPNNLLPITKKLEHCGGSDDQPELYVSLTAEETARFLDKYKAKVQIRAQNKEGGAVFGGDKLVKVKGHSDELANLQGVAEDAGIEIGDYIIPVDKNGNVSGGIKVANFRPFVGFGFGRIVPKNKRIGFLFEMGVQFHNTPEVYTDYGQLNDLIHEADNEFSEIINNITVYPVLRFRLCGKLF